MTEDPGIQWPSWVRTDEQKRRYELCLRTLLYTYGFSVNDPLTGPDRVIVMRGASTLFHAGEPTGEGSVSEEERAWMHRQGVL